MPTDIFSAYTTGENRVTATIIAVLRSLSLSRIDRILGAMLEKSEFELVQFANQPSKGGSGVPDAQILSSCRVLFETKTQRDAVTPAQLKRHLERLKDEVAKETTKALLVLTPDDKQPPAFDAVDSPLLCWSSFAALNQAIDELLEDRQEVVSEREFFLLRELQSFFFREELVGSAKDVVVVPARDAWPRYIDFHAYICQPRRSFRKVERMAFYTKGRIFPLVPRILDTQEEVEFRPGKHQGKLGELINQALDHGIQKPGQISKVIFLSPPEADTIDLGKQILNDLKSDTGVPIAFTQNQRYVSLEDLQKAHTTSDLVKD